MATLYLVATPIGNLEDITFRALRVLREVALIAAEDTRTARGLLSHYKISARLVSYNEHNMARRTPQILQALESGDVALVSDAILETFKGAIVLCPPSALADRWSRRFADPISAVASGWIGVRARARQRGAELPLVISDHADWSELTQTLKDVGAPKVWVTHGREEALVHYARSIGIDAEALHLAGREEEGE